MLHLGPAADQSHDQLEGETSDTDTVPKRVIGGGDDVTLPKQPIGQSDDTVLKEPVWDISQQ